MLLTDFEVNVGKELRTILNDSAKHFTSFMTDNISLEELSYLSLCSSTFLKEDMQKLLLSTITPKFDQAT